MESNTLTPPLLRRHDRMIKFRLQFSFKIRSRVEWVRFFGPSHFALIYSTSFAQARLENSHKFNNRVMTV